MAITRRTTIESIKRELLLSPQDMSNLTRYARYTNKEMSKDQKTLWANYDTEWGALPESEVSRAKVDMKEQIKSGGSDRLKQCLVDKTEQIDRTIVFRLKNARRNWQATKREKRKLGLLDSANIDPDVESSEEVTENETQLSTASTQEPRHRQIMDIKSLIDPQ